MTIKTTLSLRCLENTAIMGWEHLGGGMFSKTIAGVEWMGWYAEEDGRWHKERV